MTPGVSAQEFLAAGRVAGDTWSYGSPGVGTVGHIGMELLKSKTQINPVHVPYPGYPQVANAMLGGQLQLSMLPGDESGSPSLCLLSLGEARESESPAGARPGTCALSGAQPDTPQTTIAFPAAA